MSPSPSPLAGEGWGEGGYVNSWKVSLKYWYPFAYLPVSVLRKLLYWDIGRLILERQEREGWGAKIIERLSADLQETYPDMKGLSPRNLKYMRAFAVAWTDRSFVQQLAAQIPWFHNCILLDRIPDSATRIWYIRAAIEQVSLSGKLKSSRNFRTNSKAACRRWRRLMPS